MAELANVIGRPKFDLMLAVERILQRAAIGAHLALDLAEGVGVKVVEAPVGASTREDDILQDLTPCFYEVLALALAAKVELIGSGDNAVCALSETPIPAWR